MADKEQIKLLKRGSETWNRWRIKNFDTSIDLKGAELSGTDLREANLSGADLSKADLSNTNLSRANLSKANLSEADLTITDLIEGNLSGADLELAELRSTDLSYANLEGANLDDAILYGTDLTGANLSEANLRGANFEGADLTGASLKRATIGGTAFIAIDFSKSVDLESVISYHPSTLGSITFSLSKGKIPELFLRGCGLSDWEIEIVKLYDPKLTNQEVDDILYRVHDIRAHQPVQISPLFISYSHADSDFVDQIEQSLNEKGVRFWRDVHDMKAGQMEKQIDRAIRHNPTVLLILSKNSIQSDWVQHEVRLARQLEKDTEKDVLCPVSLDDSWKNSNWPQRIVEQIMEYNILDFSEWHNDEKFETMFARLIDGLNLFYRKDEGA